MDGQDAQDRVTISFSPVHLFNSGDGMAKTAVTGDQVLSQLRKHKPELVKRFGIADPALYGVYSPDDSDELFDIDLMVTSDSPTKIKNLYGVQSCIEDLMGLKVGVVTKGWLSDERRHYFEEIAIDV